MSGWSRPSASAPLLSAAFFLPAEALAAKPLPGWACGQLGLSLCVWAPSKQGPEAISWPGGMNCLAAKAEAGVCLVWTRKAALGNACWW